MSRRGRLDMRGIGELQRKLSALDKKGAKRASRKAITASANPILAGARADAPVEEGLLKKSLGKKVKQYRGGAVFAAIVGVRSSVVGEHDGKKRWPFKYHHLVEAGFVAQDGTIVPGTGYIRNSVDRHGDAAVAAMRDKLASEIELEAKKKG